MSTNKIVLKKLTTAILLTLFASTGSAYAAGLTASGCDIGSESNGSQQKIICSEADFDIDNAIAGGVQYKTSPNTNIRLNVSWDSSSNAALGVGFAGGW
ncbi:Uncharacterised protein [Yersinia kristensenii]|nr:Uncharacterised protein [Yersinia kristensenii]